MITSLHRRDIEHAEHKALFELIQNKEHWKGAIDCIIPKECYDKLDRAATFFHGQGLTIVDQDHRNYHCKSEGYCCW